MHLITEIKLIHVERLTYMMYLYIFKLLYPYFQLPGNISVDSCSELSTRHLESQGTNLTPIHNVTFTPYSIIPALWIIKYIFILSAIDSLSN